jgi:DNA-binding GntR family transcriptional regulator
MSRATMESLRSAEPIVIETLRDKVLHRLKDAILTGSFAPGQALTVRGVAEALGTSPTPVREALQRLMAEQVLEGVPNRYYRVPLMTREKFVEIREIRAVLEGMAAEKASARISPPEIARLRQALVHGEQALAKQNIQAYLTANEEFHFTIYRAAQAPVLLRSIELLWLQVGPYLNYLAADILSTEDLEAFHREAIAALERRDGPAARDAMRNDILTWGKNLEERISSAGA